MGRSCAVPRCPTARSTTPAADGRAGRASAFRESGPVVGRPGRLAGCPQTVLSGQHATLIPDTSCERPGAALTLSPLGVSQTTVCETDLGASGGRRVTSPVPDARVKGLRCGPIPSSDWLISRRKPLTPWNRLPASAVIEVEVCDVGADTGGSMTIFSRSGPSKSHLARRPRSLDEPELGCTRKPLDPRFFPQSRGSISNGDHSRELNRSAAAGVAAGGAGPMRGDSAPNIGRPSAVQGAVSAAEQVDGSHPHGFATLAARTCPECTPH